MNRELFLSILAMDSYNRGYGDGIKGLDSPGPDPESDSKIKIGEATLLFDANDRAGVARTAGFYAIAYNVANTGLSGLTGTVISYRGTTYETNGSDLSKYRDIWNGWLVGAGLLVDQSKLTLEFYKRVRASSV